MSRWPFVNGACSEAGRPLPPRRPPAAQWRRRRQRALCSTRAGTAARAGWCSLRQTSANRADAVGKAKQFHVAAAILAIRCDRILEWMPSSSCSGVRADALDHGARAVRALRRKMLLQTQRTKGAQGVDGENLLWRPIREKRDRDRDQPANEVRVAVAAIVQDHLAVGAGSRLEFQPYLTDAAHLIAFIVGHLAKRLEGMTEFDDVAIAILPVVEGGEIVADGLEISQAILE